MMWQRLKNFFLSLHHYDALSPDLRVRRQVSQRLRDRPTLSLKEWYESGFQEQGIDYRIASFAYIHFQRYSGLDFGKVRSSDRLEEDLHWVQVCWFDWDTALFDDFLQCFGIEIWDCLSEVPPATVGELITCLNQQLLGVPLTCTRRQPDSAPSSPA